MAIWPFCPAHSFTEAISWRTDVMPSWAKEQRVRLTNSPRQSFGFNYVFDHRQFELARQMAGFLGPWDVPAWPERQRINVPSVTNTLTVDTTSSNYRQGGKAILWQSDKVHEVVTIASLDAVSLTLTANTSRTYKNAFIMPTVEAYCHGGLDTLREAGPVMHAQMEWSCYDGSDLADASLYASYRGDPLVSDCPRLGGKSFSESVAVPQSLVDSGIGPVRVNLASAMVARTLGMAWLTDDRDVLWRLRCWLHSVRGSQKAFWMPTWTRAIDLKADVGAVDSTISVSSFGLPSSGDLAIVLTDGQVIPVQYSGVSLSGGIETVALTAPLGVDIGRVDVDLICPLLHVRLVQDRVEVQYQYLGDDRQMASISVMTTEVP